MYAKVKLVRKEFHSSVEVRAEMGKLACHVERDLDRKLQLMRVELFHRVYARPIQTVRIETPRTWWDGLKRALKSRWPRLLGRLRFQTEIHTVDAVAYFPLIDPPLREAQLVVQDPVQLWHRTGDHVE